MLSRSLAILIAFGLCANLLWAATDVGSQAETCKPVTVGEYSFQGSNFFRDIAMRGSVVYAATSSHVDLFNFRAIDVSDRTTPVLRGATAVFGEFSSAPRIEFSGNYAFVVTTLGLHSIDISNATEPGRVTRLELSDIRADNLRVSGGRAYVVGSERTNNRYRLLIIDVGAPTVPVQLGSLSVDGSTDFDYNWKDIEVVGNVVYIGAPALAGSGGAIRAIDVTEPAHPREIGLFTDPNIYSVRLGRHKSHLVALGNRHLLVIDVSNPVAMTLVAKVETGGSQSEDLDVVGDRALIADVVSDKLFIFDLSKLPQLQQIGSVTLDAYRVAADQRNAAVVLYNAEALDVVDVSSCFPGSKRRRAVIR